MKFNVVGKLKVLSFVLCFAPQAFSAEHAASAADQAAPAAAEQAAAPAGDHAAAPAADHAMAPAAADHAAAPAADEKVENKSFCAKKAEKAKAECSKWLKASEKKHKGKVVSSACSEAAAATDADKACKTGSHVSHGEVKFHK